MPTNTAMPSGLASLRPMDYCYKNKNHGYHKADGDSKEFTTFSTQTRNLFFLYPSVIDIASVYQGGRVTSVTEPLQLLIMCLWA